MPDTYTDHNASFDIHETKLYGVYGVCRTVMILSDQGYAFPVGRVQQAIRAWAYECIKLF